MSVGNNQLTTGNRRHFDRGSWLTVGALLGFTALCAALSAILLSQPGDGCQLNAAADPPAPITACFGDWQTPLRPGDKVLAVNGWATTDIDELGRTPTSPLPGLFAGSETTYTVLRDGATTSLVVPIRRLGAVGVLRVFGAALLGQLSPIESPLLPTLLGSLVVFLLAPQSGAARLMLVSSGGLSVMGCFVWSAFTVPVSIGVGPAWAISTMFFLALIWGWLFIPSALLLVLSFPRRVWPLTRWPRGAATAIFCLPLAASFFATATSDLGAYGALLTGGALAVVIAGAMITALTFLRGRDPVVRAQTVWMTLGLFAGFAFLPLSNLTQDLIPGVEEAYKRIPALQGLALFGIGLIFPISMGIAITRYRLFDIQIIIRRTLLYTLLTLALGAVYFGSVVALQALFVQLTGQESALAVVASTLAIAALFGPARRRLQTFIDRRFFRHKYDAQQVLEAFAQRAQYEADLDALADDMLGVVRNTLEPERAQLWLVRRE